MDEFKILRYSVDLDHPKIQKFTIPGSANVLTALIDSNRGNDQAQFWVKTNNKEPTMDINIYIFWTDGTYPDSDYRYINTVIDSKGLEWHIFWNYA